MLDGLSLTRPKYAHGCPGSAARVSQMENPFNSKWPAG